MLPIIPNRNYFLTFSGLLVVASLIVIVLWGLKFGIDFTGGTLIELENHSNPPTIPEFRNFLFAHGFNVISLQTSTDTSFLLRLPPMDEIEHQRFLKSLKEEYPLGTDKDNAFEEKRFESIGPTIGSEFRQKAYLAIAVALVAIILYIAYAFRKVSRPVASWKFGVCAIIALAHDITIPTGIYAVLGHFLRWEADLLFVTALLTILGFSVHDTIVVFDRIRENLLKNIGKNFADIANISVNQTLARSINTSLTTLLVLIALFFFGGETTNHFVFVLIIGIVFGTYSSIFVASPLLVIWDKLKQRSR